jgi:hypothetical protein
MPGAGLYDQAERMTGRIGEHSEALATAGKPRSTQPENGCLAVVQIPDQ